MKALAFNLERLKGEGAFHILERAQALESAGREILHFEIGEPGPYFATNPLAVQAAKEALDRGFTTYVPPRGIPELREATVAHVTATRGYSPSLGQVIVTPGVKPGIFLTMLALVSPGDEVIYPDPGFPTYRSLIDYLRAVPVPMPLKEENSFRMLGEDVAARVTKRTKLLIINSPHNPTGSVIPEEELRTLARLAAERGFFLLSDEIYSDLIYDGKQFSPTALDGAQERSILLDGFSKSQAMTGWRLGYIVGPEWLMEKLELLVINSFSCTASFVQKAGAEVLLHDQGAYARKMLAQLRECRKMIVEGLNSIPGFRCRPPEGAFYVFPNIEGTGMTSEELVDHLLQEAGVATLPGTAFGPQGEGYIRLSYATDLETIEKAITRIREAL